MPARRDRSLLDFLQKLQGYKTNWSFDSVLHLGNFILGAWCCFAVKLNQPLYRASQNSTDHPHPHPPGFPASALKTADWRQPAASEGAASQVPRSPSP